VNGATGHGSLDGCDVAQKLISFGGLDVLVEVEIFQLLQKLSFGIVDLLGCCGGQFSDVVQGVNFFESNLNWSDSSHDRACSNIINMAFESFDFGRH